jgi:hypothetical protein
VWQVLLISEYKKIDIKKWVGAEQSLELFSSFRHTVTVIRIDDKNEAISILEVWNMERQWAARRECGVLTKPP